MSRIIYGQKIYHKTAGQLSLSKVKDTFSQAIELNRRMRQSGQRVAYSFIDPLMHGFEAGNQFYFEVMELPHIDRLNYYRSGAGPLHALHDAKMLIDSKAYDAVFIFGYEPLLSNKQQFGKPAMHSAMDIFNGPSLLACYNGLAEIMRVELGLSEADFHCLADELFANYSRTAARLGLATTEERGPFMAQAGAPLFRLSDCANPNLDFAAGIIVANGNLAQRLDVPRGAQLDILGVKQSMVQADPGNLRKISGSGRELFPHMAAISRQLEEQTSINIKHHLAHANLLLDIYTCYPPIPVAFLLASGLAASVKDVSALLQQHEITITAGLNLGGAPWNNPVLGSLVEMCWQLPQSQARYGLVHGNGGIAESQAVALLGRA